MQASGIVTIAGVFFIASAACAVTAVGTAVGAWPLSWGRVLVGDLVTMGPALFVIAGLIYCGVAIGLVRRKNWARRLAIVISVAGLYFLIPPISSAVADLRILAIISNGAQIILRVVVLWYLMQEQTALAFT